MGTQKLRQLMAEGKLKYGDTVTHSSKPGKYMLQRICKDDSIIVSQGLDVEKWKLDSSSLVREVK